MKQLEHRKGATTGIEWCTATWNPFVGCSIISPGCTNCYAMIAAQKLVNISPAYQGVIKIAANKRPVWTGRVNRATDATMRKPMTIKGSAVIFVNSMSDFFHEGADHAWRHEALAIMNDTPRHQYQILTKRPENIASFMAWAHIERFPDNVWIGVTVEDRRYATRIDVLRTVPARIRFISFEPLIDAVGSDVDLSGIHWAIVGGESQSGAREMRDEWALDLLAACRTHGTRFFMKQHSMKNMGRKYKSTELFHPDLQVREMPEA